MSKELPISDCYSCDQDPVKCWNNGECFYERSKITQEDRDLTLDLILEWLGDHEQAREDVKQYLLNNITNFNQYLLIRDQLLEPEDETEDEYDV